MQAHIALRFGASRLCHSDLHLSWAPKPQWLELAGDDSITENLVHVATRTGTGWLLLSGAVGTQLGRGVRQGTVSLLGLRDSLQEKLLQFFL